MLNVATARMGKALCFNSKKKLELGCRKDYSEMGGIQGGECGKVAEEGAQNRKKAQRFHGAHSKEGIQGEENKEPGVTTQSKAVPEA